MKKIAILFCSLIVVLGCSYRPLPKRVKLSKECKSYFRFLQKALKQDSTTKYFYMSIENKKKYFEMGFTNCKCFVGLKPDEIRKMFGEPILEDEYNYNYAIHNNKEVFFTHSIPRGSISYGIIVANNLEYIRKAQLSRWDSTLRLY